MVHVYEAIARKITGREYCLSDGDHEWVQKHEEGLRYIEKNYLPSGAGIDNGCKIDLDKSTSEKIVIYSSFHEMNDVGMYIGWFDFTVEVVASLLSCINVHVYGCSGKNDLEDYLGDVFLEDLKREYYYE